MDLYQHKNKSYKLCFQNLIHDNRIDVDKLPKSIKKLLLEAFDEKDEEIRSILDNKIYNKICDYIEKIGKEKFNKIKTQYGRN